MIIIIVYCTHIILLLFSMNIESYSEGGNLLTDVNHVVFAKFELAYTHD